MLDKLAGGVTLAYVTSSGEAVLKESKKRQLLYVQAYNNVASSTEIHLFCTLNNN